jgi:hypothetical protein
MEHNVYLCSWSRSTRGFELWVRSHPHLRGQGSTYASAEERLIEAIRVDGGASQAVLEFHPRLPKSSLEQKYSYPELYVICGDTRFRADQRRRALFASFEECPRHRAWIDPFFQSPCCHECRIPAGPRNERPLQLIDVAFGSDGGFVTLASTTLSVFSEEFLKLLSLRERRRLEFLPLEITSPTRRRFYELVGPAGPPPVGVAGLPISGWRCGRCGHREFGYYAQGLGIHEFVARADLSNPLPGLFTVGRPPAVELCATARRWEELVGRKGTRGFTARQLGVVDDSELIRFPELAPLQARRLEMYLAMGSG